MKVTVLCSDISHPVNSYLNRWMSSVSEDFSVELVRKKQDCTSGDILFLVSCSEIISKEEREKYDNCLVLHASALPEGRGWSPHVWQLIEGAAGITLSLIEADDHVDSGCIWKQIYLPVPSDALWNEINDLLFRAEIELINFAIENFDKVKPIEQPLESASYFRKRTPQDSKIDPTKTIAEQFDLIRVCDPDRFPAYFEHRGCRYLMKLEKQDDE